MTGKNKTPLLGGHVAAGLSAWVRARAADRGVTITAVLEELIEAAMAAEAGGTGTLQKRQ